MLVEIAKCLLVVAFVAWSFTLMTSRAANHEVKYLWRPLFALASVVTLAGAACLVFAQSA